MSMTEEPHVIVKKRLKLQWSNGDPFMSNLHGLEYQNPYTLTIVLDGESQSRIDILKHELADELTAWLAGKRLAGKPALLIPKRIDEAMLNFLKFGRPPNQSDIYLWILSRTLITWNDRVSMMQLTFGQVSSDGSLQNPQDDVMLNHNSAPRPSPHQQTHTHHHTTTNASNPTGSSDHTSTSRPRPSSAPHTRTRTRRHSSGSTDSLLGTQKGAGTFKLTKEILGTSGAMAQLHTAKVKGRVAARPAFIKLGWTEDHYRLTNDINTRRHDIEDVMEQRRKVLEVSKARQMKTTNTYRNIREGNQTKRSNFNWAKDASYEVTNLDRITATISEDIQRQKCQTERTTEHIRWTMAPNGFVNRRGRYTKGLVLGPGPLPADATTGIKNPRMEKTLQSYHWDEHGRRQLRRPEDVTPGSDIEKALCLLKKAATNSSLYKLNLKQVFQDMDISGDGFVSLSEMHNFLVTIGLKMEDRLIDALFRHFDPNDSGSIHYGEFCWAFFNRRSLISQWKQSTRTLNDRQIKSKLQHADHNGNGILSRKEFAKLLKSFSIKLSDMEIDLLIDRFDKDGDGELDLDEFTAFIHAEVNPKLGDTNTKTNTSTTAGISHRGTLGSKSSSSSGNAQSGRSRALLSSSHRHHAADERKAEDDDYDDDEGPPSYDDNIYSDTLNGTAADTAAGSDGGYNRSSGVRLRLSAASSSSSSHTNTQAHAHAHFEELEDTGKTSVADYNRLSGTSSSMTLANIVNPAELSQIFAHQAKIEAKLGAKYFK